jgi:DNA-directed RNA polymerase specialized sigma24 family protein
LSKLVHANERAAALLALSEDQRKHLAAYARIMSANTGEEGGDLLQGAFVRWLASDEPVEGPERTYEFLRGAMSSIRSNIFRHAKVVRHYDGVRTVPESADDDDPIELAKDSGVSQEALVFFQQVYDLCADDEDIQLLLMSQLGLATRAEIQAELGWDNTKYEAVQKRKKRLIARFTIEGKLR